MKLIIITNFSEVDGIKAGDKSVYEFTSFSKMYQFLAREYKQAKLIGNYLKVSTVLK